MGLPDCGPGGRTGRLHAPPDVSMDNRRTWVIATAVALAAGTAGWWAFADGDDAALITAPARVADLEKTVQAVGRVNPKELVAVGAQVSGQVQRLHVVLQQRPALHLQQGLGCGVGQRPHALATACGQQHGRRLFGEGKRLGGGERRDGLGGHGGQL